MAYSLGDFKFKSKKQRKDVVDQLILNPNRSDYHKAIIAHLFTNYYDPAKAEDSLGFDLPNHKFRKITQPKIDQPAVLEFHDRPPLPLQPEHLTPKKLKRSPYLDLIDNINLRLSSYNSSLPQIKERLADDKPQCFITGEFIEDASEAVLLFIPPISLIKLLETEIFNKSTAHLAAHIDRHMNPTLVKADSLAKNPSFISPSLK